jgi:hypothetical protein
MFHGSEFEVPSSEPGMNPVIGFYTTRVVVAKNEQEAREKAVEELLKEDYVQNFIKITRTNSTKVPMVEIEKIQKLSWLQNRLQKHAGFTLYQNES